MSARAWPSARPPASTIEASSIQLRECRCESMGSPFSPFASVATASVEQLVRQADGLCLNADGMSAVSPRARVVSQLAAGEKREASRSPCSARRAGEPEQSPGTCEAPARHLRGTCEAPARHLRGLLYYGYEDSDLHSRRCIRR